MKRNYFFWLGLIVGVIAALFLALQIGVRIGDASGRSDYHVTYVRELQRSAYELAREAHTSDYGQSRLFSVRLAALSSAVGNHEEFFAIVDEDFQSVEELNESLGFPPIIGDYIPKLDVELSDEGAISVRNVEVSGEQLELIARLMIDMDERTRLRLSASREVKVVHIKSAVKASAVGGMTDVIFLQKKEATQ